MLLLLLLLGLLPGPLDGELKIRVYALLDPPDFLNRSSYVERRLGGVMVLNAGEKEKGLLLSLLLLCILLKSEEEAFSWSWSPSVRCLLLLRSSIIGDMAA